MANQNIDSELTKGQKINQNSGYISVYSSKKSLNSYVKTTALIGLFGLSSFHNLSAFNKSEVDCDARKQSINNTESNEDILSMDFVNVDKLLDISEVDIELLEDFRKNDKSRDRFFDKVSDLIMKSGVDIDRIFSENKKI